VGVGVATVLVSAGIVTSFRHQLAGVHGNPQVRWRGCLRIEGATAEMPKVVRFWTP
jgi:hypothetical protein